VKRFRAGKETGAYSAAVAATGELLFVSGHGPLRDGEWVRGTIEEETTATLESLEATIVAAGGRIADVIRCGCFLADIESFDGFNAAYKAFFGDDYPARTTVGAALSDGIKVEIDAIVRLD
jgi:2-iminobutanoate/2-iminopropanoate deaminase